MPAAILNVYQQVNSIDDCTLDALVDPDVVNLLTDLTFSEAEVAGNLYAQFIEQYDADRFYEKADSRVIGLDRVIKLLISLLRQIFEIKKGASAKLTSEFLLIFCGNRIVIFIFKNNFNILKFWW